MEKSERLKNRKAIFGVVKACILASHLFERKEGVFKIIPLSEFSLQYSFSDYAIPYALLLGLKKEKSVKKGRSVKKLIGSRLTSEGTSILRSNFLVNQYDYSSNNSRQVTVNSDASKTRVVKKNVCFNSVNGGTKIFSCAFMSVFNSVGKGRPMRVIDFLANGAERRAEGRNSVKPLFYRNSSPQDYFFKNKSYKDGAADNYSYPVVGSLSDSENSYGEGEQYANNAGFEFLTSSSFISKNDSIKQDESIQKDPFTNKSAFTQKSDDLVGVSGIRVVEQVIQNLAKSDSAKLQRVETQMNQITQKIQEVSAGQSQSIQNLQQGMQEIKTLLSHQQKGHRFNMPKPPSVYGKY
ncbi:hypothetical protein [Marinibactrum halimedae]|uniref:Uncharacterized protein n=1 Tax=Marinibactrum halimedae TaxID=1444977 RepID=A0AA37T655_9GAMM|nr:hypothetical protein [Marinibactrum halimedae]MCD9460786.1 hypothetical protein [Marinibactrum halimedae]GLS27374.1 hypothetical protein GCM10007877_30930 [Marinibactrum halimedae]